MKERDWLVPSIFLTIASGAIVVLEVPHYGVLWAAMTIYPAWLAAAAVIASACLFADMVRMRVPRPVLEMRRMIVEDRARLAVLALAVLVAGLNMITYMWVKPLLNYLVPFGTGPRLAQIDWLLFLGHDPWTLVTWLNFPSAGLIYHQAWFVMIILALVLVAWAAPSPEKSAMMLTYFMLWSLIGPLIHSLMPATGPIFYERMGHGQRFSGIREWPETQQVADYLWAIFSSRNFGAGSGISAMPSLHVATATWTAMSIVVFARWLAVPAVLYATMIFLMSIALGWHFAVDGLVGAACTVGCYFLMLAWFQRGSASAGSDAAQKHVPIQ